MAKIKAHSHYIITVGEGIDHEAWSLQHMERLYLLQHLIKFMLPGCIADDAQIISTFLEALHRPLTLSMEKLKIEALVDVPNDDYTPKMPR